MQTANPSRTDHTSAPRNYSTEEAAAMLKVRPHTLRTALCRAQHYMGVRPIKLPNGRLLWPAGEVDRLTAPDAGGSKRASA